MNAAPLYLGSEVSERTIPVQFTYNGAGFDDALWTLIGRLDPANRTPRPLVVTLPDGIATAELDCVVALPYGLPGDATLNYLLVTFIAADPYFRATTPTIQGPTSFAASGSTTFTVGGKAKTTPLIEVSWTAQRPSANAIVGWKHRRTVRVANQSDQPLENYPLQLGPWNTAALVSAGKMRADMLDVAVFNAKGERMKTEKSAENSPASFVWFVVEQLAAGDFLDFDVCYGNTSASLPLGFPYYKVYSPAIDINATNGTVVSYAAPNVTTAKNLDALEHVGSTFMVTGGLNAGQYRQVQSHTTGASAQLVMTRALNTVDNTSTYSLVRSGFVGDGGTSSAVSATTITDSAQVWGVDQWIGGIVETIDASGVVIVFGSVTGNTIDTLTITSWSGTTPVSPVRYRVYLRNGRWIWFVGQGSRNSERERGRWRLNRGTTKPSNMWFPVDGTPGAWSITTYNPGQAANDYNQLRVTKNGSQYYSALNAKMARKDGANFPEEGFGNGVQLTVPLGLLGVKHDFQIQNPSGMCRAFFGCREQGGQDWEAYKEYSTTQASLTTIATAYYDLTPYGTPVHLLAALTSDDDAAVADDQTGTANLQDGSVLEAYIDTRLLSVTNIETAAEENIYDMSLTIRRGGASEAVGDDIVRIGGEDHHLFMETHHLLLIGDDGNVPLGVRLYSGRAGTSIASDTVTDANGTTLEAHVPSGGGTWTKHSISGAGSATIDNNRVHNPNTATTHLYYHSQVPAGGAFWGAADYDVVCDVVMRSDNNASASGPAGRIDTAVANYYFVRYHTNTNVWQLLKSVAGVETQLGPSVAQALTIDQAYSCTLSMRSSGIKVYVDGLLIIAAIDTAITAAGRGGLRVSDLATSTVGVHLDNYSLRQGGNDLEEEHPNAVRIYHVESDYFGVRVRANNNDLLPLSPGSTTLRISDEDGAVGTVETTVIYSASYL